MNFLVILLSTLISQIFAKIEKNALDIPQEVLKSISEVATDISFINIPEDGRLNFTELANKYGYNCEEYEVTTEDGYILTLFHIPGDKKKVVLLNHGIIDSGDTFLIRNNKSLVITLATLKYDVWVMNSRGTRYAMQHVYLDPRTDEKRFFNFSFHEVGIYDVPANIDFVRNATGADKIAYIGHSMGTTSLLVMGSEKPEYNDKINVAVLLAPVAYLTHVKGILTVLRAVAQLIIDIGTVLNIHKVVLYSSLVTKLIRFICSQSVLGYEVCFTFISLASGFDYSRLGTKFFGVVLGHYPAGTSFKTLAHYGQVSISKEFRRFNYGDNNLEHYGVKTPPLYDLNKVTVNTAMFCGKNDLISTLKDVATLRPQLRNVVEYHEMGPPSWNHVDFVWGNDADTELYPLVVDVIEKYNK